MEVDVPFRLQRVVILYNADINYITPRIVLRISKMTYVYVVLLAYFHVYMQLINKHQAYP